MKPVSAAEIAGAFGQLALGLKPPDAAACRELAALLNQRRLPRDDTTAIPGPPAVKLARQLRPRLPELVKSPDTASHMRKLDSELRWLINTLAPSQKPRKGWHIRAVEFTAALHIALLQTNPRSPLVLAKGRTAPVINVVTWAMERTGALSDKEVDHRQTVLDALNRHLPRWQEETHDHAV